jgi:hypothetical protein
MVARKRFAPNISVDAAPVAVDAVGAVALSIRVSERIQGRTHTWSPGNASRQTKPCRQVSGPYWAAAGVGASAGADRALTAALLRMVVYGL